GDPERERQIELARDESENRRRAVWNYRPFNSFKIGAPLLPILFIPHQLDGFVLLVGHEFERSGADWMLPHVLRRYVTWVNGRVARGEQRNKGGLRPLQVKRHRVALGADLLHVAVPSLAR